MRIVTVLKTGHGCLWTIPILTRLAACGHDVVVLLPEVDSPLARRCAENGIRVVPSPAPVRSRSPFRQAVSVWRLRGLLRALDPDVLHYHLYAAAVLSRLASLGRGPTRRPARVHMVPGPLYLENPLIEMVERRFVRADDLVVCSSGHIRERYLDLGVPPERLPTASYGVDLSSFAPSGDDAKAKARAELGLDPSALVVVCVAYFYPPKWLVHRGRGIKGHDALLQAWSRFREHSGPATLVLVGGGHGSGGEAYRDYLRAQAAGLPSAGSVLWAGAVSDVRPFYAAADVSVSPSLSENYGAVAEASACGVPSIATAVGGLPELVDDHTGWLVPPDDPAALAVALRTVFDLHQAALRGDDGGDGLALRGQAARRRAEHLLDQEKNRGFIADAIVGAARSSRAERRS
ncbi:hypothetical protein CC117_00840 [Parafrankia colletiae]|uniref:Glycosyltransferase subfamily 4-like N-terminal domain-containing protein n=1 Tax=Parafrankia colletiae TaxID=573497 RepID=A0A1S1RLT2_9ACTN|nr:glycosyltransferase [Parafrankia colletiae]MCK9903257.1 glycosyltransferase [Frankia sp. Cpl3]OHV46232.1 hypothetical protein CC117_00840 [Parafrankia colletiae]